MEIGLRLEARKQYMKLSGKKRFDLMVFLGIDRLPIGEAVEKCLDHIESNL